MSIKIMKRIPSLCQCNLNIIIRESNLAKRSPSSSKSLRKKKKLQSPYDYTHGQPLQNTSKVNGRLSQDLNELDEQKKKELEEQILKEFTQARQEEFEKQRKLIKVAASQGKMNQIGQFNDQDAKNMSKDVASTDQKNFTIKSMNRTKDSGYIKAYEKNQFFARTIRYKPIDIESTKPKRTQRPSTAAINGKMSTNKKNDHVHLENLNLKPDEKDLNEEPKGQQSTSRQRPTTSTKHMKNDDINKMLLLGTRTTFSKEYKYRKKADIINKSNDLKTKKPEDYPIYYEDVIPSKLEEFDQIRRIDLLKLDAKEGFHIDEFIQLLKETNCSLDNYESLAQTYYLHKTRFDRLKIPEKVITHSEALQIAKEIFPNKDYTRKDIDEFLQLYESINNFTPPPNISAQQINEKLRDKNLSRDERKRLERLYILMLNSRKEGAKESEKARLRREEKELEQREHDAILAAHYYRLKDFYKEREYGNYAKNLLKLNKDFNLMRTGSQEQDQDALKYRQNARSLAKSILNEENLESAQFSKKLKELNKTKMKNDYDVQLVKPISDVTELKYPGLRERLEKLKTKKYESWNFEDETNKAKIRWAHDPLVEYWLTFRMG